MAERIQRATRKTDTGEPVDPPIIPAAPQVAAMDDVLDAIDEVLETNAQSFVQGFVQKGGQ